MLDKMCKYEMDLASIVEDTELTLFCPQTDGQTDKWMDKVKPVYPPFNFVEAGGITRFMLPCAINRPQWGKGLNITMEFFLGCL